MERQELCEISWWRGYRSGQFYAALAGSGEAVAESPSLRSRGGEPPEKTEAAEDAYEALAELLVELGWEPDGRGEHWYSRRFWRVVDGYEYVAADVEVPEPEEAFELPPDPEPVLLHPPQAKSVPRKRDRGRPPLRVLRPARDRLVQFAAAILFVLALVALATLVDRGRASEQTHVRRAQKTEQRRAPGARATAAPRSTHGAPVGGLARLSIAGTDSGSWVEVRDSSGGGAILYNGALGGGARISFAKPRLWVRLGAAGNVDVRLGGRHVVGLAGTVDAVVTPAAVQIL